MAVNATSSTSSGVDIEKEPGRSLWVQVAVPLVIGSMAGRWIFGGPVKFRPILRGKWYSYFGYLRGLWFGFGEHYLTHRRYFDFASTTVEGPLSRTGECFPRHSALEDVRPWDPCGY